MAMVDSNCDGTARGMDGDGNGDTRNGNGNGNGNRESNSDPKQQPSFITATATPSDSCNTMVAATKTANICLVMPWQEEYHDAVAVALTQVLLCSKQQWQQQSCNSCNGIAAALAMQVGMVSQEFVNVGKKQSTSGNSANKPAQAEAKATASRYNGGTIAAALATMLVMVFQDVKNAEKTTINQQQQC